MTLRANILTIAPTIVGLSAAPGTLDAFASFLAGPADTHATGVAMATYRNPATGVVSSTCGLVVRALWREAGIVEPRISASYLPRIGRVFEDLKALAQERGALVTLGANDAPTVKPGDAVMVNGDQRDGHVYTVLAVTEDGVLSVDGGETDQAGRQCIKQRRKRWTRGPLGFWYDRADDGGPQRRITHVVDVDRLEAATGPKAEAAQ